MKIRHLYIAPAHNYYGRHGKGEAGVEIEEVSQIDLVASRGIQGDRFFDYKPNYKGQITFFDLQVVRDLQTQFGIQDKDASVFRRNVVLEEEGLDLNNWIGKEFTVQGLSFLGTEEASPCYWMDQAFCVGAHEALKGRGGLRAKILTDGSLQVDET